LVTLSLTLIAGALSEPSPIIALGHAAVQHVEPLLALAAADDLADPRCRR
jgi:hypothetical protein